MYSKSAVNKEVKMTKYEEILTAVLGLTAAFTACSVGQMVLFYILAVCAAFDLKERIIPSRFLITGVMTWVCFNFQRFSILRLASAFVIALLLFILTLLYEKLRLRKAIGGGDIKLFFVIALFIGFDKTLIALLLACAIAIVFVVVCKPFKLGPFPWAPAIALGTMIAAVF